MSESTGEDISHGLRRFELGVGGHIPEAQMLHLLDMMDARMYCMHEALLATPRGAFSDRVRALDGRKLYHPDLDEEQAHG